METASTLGQVINDHGSSMISQSKSRLSIYNFFCLYDVNYSKVTSVCNFAWQCIHAGIDCPISGGRGRGPRDAIAAALVSGGRCDFKATMNIESSHCRPDPRRQFLGLATDPTRQDSIPLVVAGS